MNRLKRNRTEYNLNGFELGIQINNIQFAIMEAIYKLVTFNFQILSPKAQLYSSRLEMRLIWSVGDGRRRRAHCAIRGHT